MSDFGLRCDDCGQFMDCEEPGSSMADQYDFVRMEPDYCHWRCHKCTAIRGPVNSNACPWDGDMTPFQSRVPLTAMAANEEPPR